MKYLFNKPLEKMNILEFQKNIRPKPYEFKKIILEYLKRFPECAFTSEPVRDKYTNEIVYGADNARSDGEYTWYEDEIYHFEKYDLKLSDDFVNHVLSQVNY